MIRLVVELVALSIGFASLLWLLARLVRTAEFPKRPMTRSIVELRAALLCLYGLMIAFRVFGDYAFRQDLVTAVLLLMSLTLARQVLLFEQEQRIARHARRRRPLPDPERQG